MTGPELRRALHTLGWSQKRAAKALAVGGGQQRISDWCRGKKKVPGYIAAHVETHIRLKHTREHLTVAWEAEESMG